MALVCRLQESGLAGGAKPGGLRLGEVCWRLGAGPHYTYVTLRRR